MEKIQRRNGRKTGNVRENREGREVEEEWEERKCEIKERECLSREREETECDSK